MPPPRALQLFTIAFLVLGAVSISSGVVTDDLVPTPLREWQKESISAMSLTVAVPLAVVATGCLVSVLVASVALLQLKRWGAWLHLGSTVTALLTISFFGPAIQHPVVYVVESLSMLVAGSIYGLAFFSDALPGNPKHGSESEARVRTGSR